MIPRDQTVLLEVDGMKCGGCVQAVERILLEQPNVSNASVNLVARTALIDLKDSEGSLELILEALASRGFYANLREENPEQIPQSELNSLVEWWRQWRQLMVAMVLLLAAGGAT